MVGFSWIFMGFPYLRGFTGGCMINGWRLVYGWWWGSWSPLMRTGSSSKWPWILIWNLWLIWSASNNTPIWSFTQSLSISLWLGYTLYFRCIHRVCPSLLVFVGSQWPTLGIPNHTWIWLFSVTKSQWWMMASGHCSIVAVSPVVSVWFQVMFMVFGAVLLCFFGMLACFEGGPSRWDGDMVGAQTSENSLCAPRPGWHWRTWWRKTWRKSRKLEPRWSLSHFLLVLWSKDTTHFSRYLTRHTWSIGSAKV